MTPQTKSYPGRVDKTQFSSGADEIYEAVRKRIPRVSLGTVYRNLEILSELGEIQKLELAGSMNRFDWDTNKHYHIRCMECGRVENAPLAPLKSDRR
jgi:Fe2+ or Zn2+ uptake regulation protein